MKRCFFVFGPESSGNRLMARILIAAGCYGRGDTDQQPEEIINSGEDDIVIHISFPFGARGCNRHWPEIILLNSKAYTAGYKPQAIVMVRDTLCMCHSQVKAGHVLTVEEAYNNINEAYARIFQGIHDVKMDCTVVTYESIILHPVSVCQWLLTKLGLNITNTGKSETIVDENAKWYQYPILWDEIIRKVDLG